MSQSAKLICGGLRSSLAGMWHDGTPSSNFRQVWWTIYRPSMKLWRTDIKLLVKLQAPSSTERSVIDTLTLSVSITTFQSSPICPSRFFSPQAPWLPPTYNWWAYRSTTTMERGPIKSCIPSRRIKGTWSLRWHITRLVYGGGGDSVHSFCKRWWLSQPVLQWWFDKLVEKRVARNSCHISLVEAWNSTQIENFRDEI